jgi:hypothetical protein
MPAGSPGRRIAPLFAALPLVFAAQASAQVGINGTRQAASTGVVEIVVNPLSRCGRGDRGAVAAAAGSGARGVERERLIMDYRRLRYAGSGLTEAEAALLEARARRLEAGAGRGYRYHSYESGAGRRHAAGGYRNRHGC